MYYVFYKDNYVGTVDDPDEAFELVMKVYPGLIDDSEVDIEEAQPNRDDYPDPEYTDELSTCYNSLDDPDEIAWENEQRELHYGGQSEFRDHWTLDE